MLFIDLKSKIHKLGDNIENENFLQAVHDVLTAIENSKDGEIWSSLTDNQETQVLLALDESDEPQNLINIKKIFPDLLLNSDIEISSNTKSNPDKN